MEVEICLSDDIIGFEVRNNKTKEVIKIFLEVNPPYRMVLNAVKALRYCKENYHTVIESEAVYPKMPNVIALSENLELLQDEMTQKTIEGYIVTGSITKIDDECYVIPMSLKSVVDGTWKPEEGILVEEYV